MVIRFYDAPDVVQAATDVCPDCDGNGSIGSRVFSHLAEPYAWQTCSACSGTGEVPAEAVMHCVECDAPVWADRVCLHQLGVLCSDHAAPCHECTGVRGDR